MAKRRARRKDLVVGETKICRECGEEKMLDPNFSKQPTSKGGYRHICKSCRKKIGKAWEVANKPKRRSQRRAWGRANKDKINAWSRRDRRRMYASNPPKYREMWERWMRAHPTYYSEYCQTEHGRLLRRLNVARRRARMKNLPCPLTDEETMVIFAAFGGTCAYCGGAQATDVEHVISVLHGGGLTAENVLPACGPCNRGKGGRTLFVDFCAKREVDGAAIIARRDAALADLARAA